jgi:hypothetical protein
MVVLKQRLAKYVPAATVTHAHNRIVGRGVFFAVLAEANPQIVVKGK